MTTSFGPQAPGPVPGQSVPPGPPLPEKPRRRGFWQRLLWAVAALILIGSVLLNVALLLLLGVTGLHGLGGKAFARNVLRDGDARQTVAVLTVAGTIDEDAAALVEQFCRSVRGDKDVKAVVLRVVSGGGMISPCDQIYTLVKDLKEQTGKKVVVSMGSVAASGGYYISAPADQILAEPTTVTGSIGVLAVYPLVKGTLDRIGVDMRIIRSTHADAWKAAPNIFEEPQPHQLKELQSILDAMQEQFEQVVRRERAGKIRLPEAEPAGAEDPSDLDRYAPFNGRVYLAETARDLGLVDRIGYLSDAVSAAAELAGLSRPKVVEYVRRRSIFDQMGLVRGGSVLDLKVLHELQSPRLLMVWQMDE